MPPPDDPPDPSSEAPEDEPIKVITGWALFDEVIEGVAIFDTTITGWAILS